MTFLAYIHEIILIERYLGDADIPAIKNNLMMNNITRPFSADLAQSAVFVYPLSDERAAASSPFF